ncbi:MAG: Uma2 family endonuclease [Candidatus Eremiobacteraeota bacterium]|nr:Uma2 family endonuclease [Candidatus Eremiobacteraeota bacterium]
MADLVRPERPPLTYEDYAAFPDDRNRYEIMEGELYMTPGPGTKHQKLSGRLFSILSTYIEHLEEGSFYYAPLDVILDNRTVMQPDLLYLSKERASLESERGIEGPPDLVIEILSPSSMRNDRVFKFRIYAKYRIEWYWMLDPDTKVLEEYALSGEGYTLVAQINGDEPFRPRLFPGLSLDLSRVWV